MPEYPFEIGHAYTKKDIYNICSVPPEKQRGVWDTGYVNFKGDWFVFANVGTPGRTGHDYANRFVGDDLVWYGKTNSRIGHPSINSILEPNKRIYVFFRDVSIDPFVFAGIASPKSVIASIPVQITWEFSRHNEPSSEVLTEEITVPNNYFEGSTKRISANVYERNTRARRKCIEFYGYRCSVCDFDFKEIFGKIGEKFIHVHHLQPMASIDREYNLDPIKDLRPICPNCHAMIHRKKEPLSIEELKKILK